MPIIGILEVTLDFEDVYLLINYVYLEMIIVAICGYLGMKKAMWLLLALFYTWIFITGLTGVMFFTEYAATESIVFGMLVYWVYRRPEWIPSDPPSDTVQIAFYYGDKSPFVAKIMALLGMNVTGIAIVIGNEAIIPVGKSGKLEKRSREALRKWIKLDTRFKPTEDLLRNFHALEGKAVKYAGCITAFQLILVEIRPGYRQAGTPSSLMIEVLAMGRGIS